MEQAAVLSELFCGQWSLLPGRRRATICDLIKFLKRHSADAALWDQLCPVGASPPLHMRKIAGFS